MPTYQEQTDIAEAGGYLNMLAEKCLKTSTEHGFWGHISLTWELDVEDEKYQTGQVSNPSIWGEKIALMHSEASEMLEALRDGNEELLEEECADLLIRLLDFTAARGINIDGAVFEKMKKNEGRPHLHGRKW